MSFKTEREDRGLIQQAVAKAMGMTQPAYARIESDAGRKPTKQHTAAFRMAMMLYDSGKWPDVLEGT